MHFRRLPVLRVPFAEAQSPEQRGDGALEQLALKTAAEPLMQKLSYPFPFQKLP